MLMGAFVLTGMAVWHNVGGGKQTLTRLSTLGIPQVRRMERTDDDDVRVSFVSLFVLWLFHQ